MILASNNEGKVKEFKRILEGYEIISLRDAKIDVDVVEDGKTFYENASKKAHEIYELTHTPVVADDSGLCIEALNGFPGVNTHRFLGIDVSDYERNEYLLNLLKKYQNRRAHVVCDIVYYDGVIEIHTKGLLFGNISSERRGENGFGFDEIFELSSGETLAELSDFHKDKVSARNNALVKLRMRLNRGE